MRDQQPIIHDGFGGLFDRGNSEAVPATHLYDILNMEFIEKGVQTRGGFAPELTLDITGGIRQFIKYEREDGDRYICLGIDGKLYDTGQAVPTTPILTVVGMTAFSALILNERVFISPHDRNTGLTGVGVYVYDPDLSALARLAAGSPPTNGAFAAATSATAGSVSAGTHLIFVAFETDTGFITAPGAALVYVAPGSRKIDLTAIPTGPAGTSKRHILATKLIVTYDGNPDNYEAFFVPGAVINNNVATTLTIDFIDSALVSTADYLLDQLSTIPAGTAICTYQSSMCVGGEAGDNKHVVRVSRAGEPESMSSVDGFVEFGAGEAGSVKSIGEHRGQLYAWKSGRTYGTHANGDAPSTWDVIVVDAGIGAEVFSVSDSLSSSDIVVVASKGGINGFVGAYGEKSLTDNIEYWWQGRTHPELTEISVDPVKKQIYCLITNAGVTTGYTEPETILVGDFTEGFDPDKLRWSIWGFDNSSGGGTRQILSIQTDDDGLLLCISGDKSLYRYDPEATKDVIDGEDTIITNHIEIGDVVGDAEGSIFNFLAVRIKAMGFGTPICEIMDQIGDPEVVHATPVFDRALTDQNPDVLEALFNVRDHAIRVRIAIRTIDEYMQIRRVAIFGKKLWASRPR